MKYLIKFLLILVYLNNEIRTRKDKDSKETQIVQTSKNNNICENCELI